MPRIENYRFGHLVVDGEEQTRDVIVLADRVLSNWWRADGHRLALADLDEVVDELPERLLVGPAHTGRCAQTRRRSTSSGNGVSRSRRCRRTRPCAATASSTLATRRPRCT
jgi:hypothetical protein